MNKLVKKLRRYLIAKPQQALYRFLDKRGECHCDYAPDTGADVCAKHKRLDRLAISIHKNGGWRYGY